MRSKFHSRPNNPAKKKMKNPGKLKYPLLRKHRLMRLFGIREMAAKIGISRQALSCYERGIYPPSVDVFERLKKALGLKGDFFEYFERTARSPVARRAKKRCKARKCNDVAVCDGRCIDHYREHLEKKDSLIEDSEAES